MKTLILVFLTTFGSTTAMSQTTISANKAIFLKAPAKSIWQVSQAIQTPEGFLLVGQSKPQHSEAKMLLLETDKMGKTAEVKEYPYPKANAVAYCNDKSIVLLNVSKTEMLLTKMSFSKGEVIWQKNLKNLKGGSIATHADGRIGVVGDNDENTFVYEFSSDGNQKWEIKLPKQNNGILPKSNIVALSDGTYGIIGGGRIWGLGNTGQILWQFGSHTEQIKWQNIKQLKNGEIVAVGWGISQVFGTKNTDIHIWSIARDGSKIAWASLIGEEENQDKAFDFIETSNGNLVLLCQKDNQTELISLDYEHQSKVIFSKENDKNQQLRFLLPNENSNYVAIGNTWDENGKQIILQTFEQKIEPAQKKPNLFMLSVGVNADLQFTKQDAEAMSQNYAEQAGKWFDKTHIQTFTADNNTKAGELAKTFELLSTKGIQNNDLVIIYFSGNGLAIDDDYLLLGSDYNPAALRSTSIRMSQLLKDLDNLPGKKLILLDACYSGAAIKLPSNVSIITASTANQAAFEDSQWQHGAFTKVLIEALSTKKADTNADGYTTLNELFDYTKKKLPILTQTKRTQNPLLLHKGDDFVVFEK